MSAEAGAVAAAGVVFGSVDADGDRSVLATAAGTLASTEGAGGAGLTVVAAGVGGGADVLGPAAGGLTSTGDIGAAGVAVAAGGVASGAGVLGAPAGGLTSTGRVEDAGAGVAGSTADAPMPIAGAGTARRATSATAHARPNLFLVTEAIRNSASNKRPVPDLGGDITRCGRRRSSVLERPLQAASRPRHSAVSLRTELLRPRVSSVGRYAAHACVRVRRRRISRPPSPTRSSAPRSP